VFPMPHRGVAGNSTVLEVSGVPTTDVFMRIAQ
jgi:hypothetical protein